MKRQTRQVYSGILALALMASVAGCSGGTENTQTTQQAPQTTQEAVTEAEAPKEESKEEATEKTMFTPGTYTVEGMGHNDIITVDVTFSETEITDIKVVSHDETKAVGDVAMDAMAAEILERQSLNVDALSGATVTSVIFRNLIGKAVEEAGGDTKDLQIEEPVDTAALPDENVDVVVVGSGGAGLAATVTAAENNLNVILIEQLGILGGASARAGGMNGEGTKVMEKYGIEYTVEDYKSFLCADLGPNLDPALLNIEYCEEMAIRNSENINWLYDMGVEFGEPWGGGNHWGVGAERVTWKIVNCLHERMDELKVDYRMNTKATSLEMDGDKVTGVVVTASNGTEYTIYAQAVILATGGYLGNSDMVAQYKPEYANNSTDVSIGCDGSGLQMALEVGAGTACMDDITLHGLATKYNGVSRSLITPAMQGAIAINQDGERYYAKAASHSDLGAATLKQEKVFVVMNEELFNSEAIQNDHGLSNIKEMYTICDTIDELAEKLEVNGQTLKGTIERYGEFVRNGVDEDFGKAASGLTSDFSKGPYYAVQAQCENHTLYGGLTTDNSAHVLKENGSVIEGLYAAGEVACFKSAGRSPLPESIDMGRVAARTVKAMIEAK